MIRVGMPRFWVSPDSMPLMLASLTVAYLYYRWWLSSPLLHSYSVMGLTTGFHIQIKLTEKLCG